MHLARRRKGPDSPTYSDASFGKSELKIQTEQLDSEDDLEGTPVSTARSRNGSLNSLSSALLVDRWKVQGERMSYSYKRLGVLIAWIVILVWWTWRQHDWLPNPYHFVKTGTKLDLEEQIKLAHREFKVLRLKEQLQVKKELQGNIDNLPESEKSTLANTHSDYPTMFDPYVPNRPLFSEHHALDHTLKLLGMDSHDEPRARPVLSWVQDRDGSQEVESHFSTATTSSLRHALDYIAREGLLLVGDAKEHGWTLQVEEQVASGIQKQTQRTDGIEYHKIYTNISNIIITLTPSNLANRDVQPSDDVEWGSHPKRFTSPLTKPSSDGTSGEPSFHRLDIPTLLINTHIDSAWGTPGTNDAAIPTGILLELLRVLSKTQVPHCVQRIAVLINGAEEQGLDGAHAFITQHPLRNTVWSAINMDSAGAGAETVFQATSQGWIQALKSLTWPQGDVVFSDIFRTGILISETDYRIFRAYSGPPVKKSTAWYRGQHDMVESDGDEWTHQDGTRSGWKGRKIVGIDMATYRNNYIYHTSTDSPNHVPPGAVLHWGHNLVNLVKHLAFDAVKDVRDLDSGKWSDGSEAGGVWRDVLGWFVISYGPWTAKLIHVLISLGALRAWYKYSGPNDVEDALGMTIDFKSRIVHALACTLSIPAATLAPLILIKSPWFSLASRGRSMAWFGNILWPVITFGPISLLAGWAVSVLLPFHLLVRGQPRSIRNGAVLTSVGFERRVAAGYLIPLSLFTLTTTWMGLGASHLPLSLLIACWVGLHVSRPKPPEPSTFTPVTPTTPILPTTSQVTVSSGFAYTMSMLIAIVGVGRASYSALETFVPMMARSAARFLGTQTNGWDQIMKLSTSSLVDQWFADRFVGVIVGFLIWLAWFGWIGSIYLARTTMSRALLYKDQEDVITMKSALSKTWIFLTLLSMVSPMYLWTTSRGFQGDKLGWVVERKRLYIQYSRQQGVESWQNQLRVAHADPSWNQFDETIQFLGTLWETPIKHHVANQIAGQWKEKTEEKLQEWDLAWPRSPMVSSLTFKMRDDRRGKFIRFRPMRPKNMIKVETLESSSWDEAGLRKRLIHLKIDHRGVDYLSIVISKAQSVEKYGLKVEEDWIWEKKPAPYISHGRTRVHLRQTGQSKNSVMEIKLEVVADGDIQLDIQGVDGRTWGIPSEEDAYGVYSDMTGVGDEEWQSCLDVMEKVKSRLPVWTDATLLVTIQGSWNV